MKILVLSRYGTAAASTRQRFTQYFPYLADHGIKAELAPLVDDAWVANIGSNNRSKLDLVGAYARRFRDVVRSGDYDLLWIGYETFPYLPGFFERLPAILDRPYIVDYDDAIFHNYDHHPRRVVRALLGRKLQGLLSRADAVTCGNAYLEAYAARFCESTLLLPTVVDCTLYRPAPTAQSTALGAPVVGWIGSPTTWVNVEPLLDVVRDISREHGAEIHVIGAGARAEGLSGIRTIAWQEAREIAEVQTMDIGIMPLIDRPFQRGKCGYKLIQYMACGLPVVASPVGVNGDIVENGVTGFLAEAPEQWAVALDRLLGDPALRRQMGTAGRTRAVRDYSLEAHRDRLRDLLVRVASRRHGGEE